MEHRVGLDSNGEASRGFETEKVALLRAYNKWTANFLGFRSSCPNTAPSWNSSPVLWGRLLPFL